MIFTCLMLLTTVLVLGKPLCDISKYDNDINRAMGDCCNQGGGKVHIPKGEYTNWAPFSFACSNLEIELATDAHIFATTNRSAALWKQGSFVRAEKLDNVTLSSKGKGVLDGSGSAWWSDATTSGHPYMVVFSHCTNVLVNQITLQNSAKLTLYPSHCNNVKIYNVSIDNPYTTKSRNLDCIDPSGNNIHIKDCTLHCGDDNVAIKGPASNVLVEDTFLGTGHGASIGSVTDTEVVNITFRNIQMQDTDNGCRIKTKRGYSGGSVSNIRFDSFSMDGVKHPIVLDGLYTDGPPSNSSETASISNVSFLNIYANNSQKGAQLQCNPANPCKHILLDNVRLEPHYTPECNDVHGSTVAPVEPSQLQACIQV